MTGEMRCIFCSSEVRGSRNSALVTCKVCGLVPNPSKLEGMEGDEIKILLEIGPDKASRVVGEIGVSGLRYVIRYEALRRKGKLSEIRKLREEKPRLRKDADRVLRELFGYISPNELAIAQFIRACADVGIPADRVARGLEMLDRIARKRTLMLSDLAAVCYLVSEKTQATCARMFGVSDVSLRSALRKLEKEFSDFLKKY
jgi:hypothetical protein